MRKHSISDSYCKKLTIDRLLQVLNYDYETGVFTWMESGRGKYKRAGAPAGAATRYGYLTVCVDGTIHLAHRLAWFYMTGAWPLHEIDHIDGNKINNKFSNLRDVARGVNQQNIRIARADSKTGVLGVSPTKNGKFVAVVQLAGKQNYLGYYDTIEQASSAYLEAKRKMHIGCTI